MKRHILYKFCSLETPKQRKNVKRLIVNRELYFSDPATFNDPYDCNIGLHLRHHLNPFGVLCLSTKGCDMILMFSHYANRHQGVCLQFEIDEDDTIAKVAPFNGREVEYRSNIPPFNANRPHMTLLTKYKKWQYEKEYRVLTIVRSEKDRIKKYKLGQLRGAIYGLHMKSDHVASVRQWFMQGRHKKVFFRKATISQDGFALRCMEA